jgi:uncharacterized protein (DUF736 family)
MRLGDGNKRRDEIGKRTNAVIQQTPRANENASGFRITGKPEFEPGVAWDEIRENDNRYISCQFACPMFPSKVYRNVVVGRDGWQPLWNRGTPKAATKIENARFRDAA